MKFHQADLLILGQDSLSNKQNNKTIKLTFVQDSPSLDFIRLRFTMSKNKLGEDSPFPKFMHLKIRRRDGVESLTILEEGEFKLAIDGCIKGTVDLYDWYC